MLSRKEAFSQLCIKTTSTLENAYNYTPFTGVFL